MTWGASMSSQYTYASEDCKPHMYIAPSDNDGMTKKEMRQVLARNVADRMHRDPNLDTQKKLGAKAKIAQPHISRILRGTSAATIDAVAALAAAFSCQPWELLADTELTRRAAIEKMIGSPVPEAQPAKSRTARY
jgi:transcriptional regulator with XRE-family HTH domain